MRNQKAAAMFTRKKVAGSVVGLILFAAISAAGMPRGMPPEQVVEVAGQKLHYYEAGRGKVVILLHGLGADSRHWDRNIDPLAKDFHVIALDQIGFGNSSKPLLRYTTQAFVESLRGFMQAMQIPKATLVGNSLGGWIAAEFALRYPQMVDKLVLVDAAGLRPEASSLEPPHDVSLSSPLGIRRVWKFMSANKQWATEDLGLDALERHVRNGDSYTIASTVMEMLAGDEFLDSRLAAIQVPTLIVWGRDDALIPLPFAERFHKGIPGSRLVLLKGCSHLPMMQKPKDFNKAVLKFLNQA